MSLFQLGLTWFALLFPRLMPVSSSRTRGGSRKPLTSRGKLCVVRRRSAAAGIDAPDIGCHSFRAGAATHLLEQGSHRSALQDLLEHRDPRVAQLYDHCGWVVSASAVDRLASCPLTVCAFTQVVL
jgi:hypothetical protein